MTLKALEEMGVNIDAAKLENITMLGPEEFDTATYGPRLKSTSNSEKPEGDPWRKAAYLAGETD